MRTQNMSTNLRVVKRQMYSERRIGKKDTRISEIGRTTKELEYPWKHLQSGLTVEKGYLVGKSQFENVT